ncbi:DUF4240 domain-containing protein [Hymenobacter sp. NST-14]|uniref:DUF4240 domain-containing protein n=1 Tax=Hymenobacter piscis TaxID=2839984 RepID=UPI001C01C094|nr:DUF4240 domain-containing protein [Hymenobacter piscis]MBT9391695.1 DUF4240 domain-containing protein [Hymenobacter piscis]
MDKQQFWQLIEQAKRRSGGDVEEQAEHLQEKLATLLPEEIIAFEDMFQHLMHEAYQSNLWAAAYIILGGCSDDGFEYFRAWLIARGQKVFETALAEPDSLAKIIKVDDAEESEAESMLYVARMAYEEQSGKDDFDKVTTRYSLPAIDLNWGDNEQKIIEMLPKLSRKFA